MNATKELCLNDLVKRGTQIVMLSGCETVREVTLACRLAHMHIESRRGWVWLVK